MFVRDFLIGRASLHLAAQLFAACFFHVRDVFVPCFGAMDLDRKYLFNNSSRVSKLIHNSNNKLHGKFVWPETEIFLCSPGKALSFFSANLKQKLCLLWRRWNCEHHTTRRYKEKEKWINNEFSLRFSFFFVKIVQCLQSIKDGEWLKCVFPLCAWKQHENFYSSSSSYTIAKQREKFNRIYSAMSLFE